MLDTRIDPRTWPAFFDGLLDETPDHASADVRVVRDGEVEGEEEEAWTRFLGATYEPRTDTLTVALDGLDHRITDLREVWAEHGPGGHVHRVVVLGPEGARDEVTFRSWAP